jgi:class 3 adenylate cyclase
MSGQTPFGRPWWSPTLPGMARCRRCGEENPLRARFCLGCGTALDATPEDAGAEERKVVSVLFCDLVGFTSRSDKADPEDVRAALRPYYSILRSELERFGGTVEKFVGDAVMAVFGAPLVHEDDAERAVRAGLAILAAIGELNAQHPGLDMAVRVGIATGEVVVSLGARPVEGEGIVAGDVVNTAARLQTVAPVGGLVVGEGTYRLTRNAIDYVALDPVLLKGKTEPVPIWRVTGARSRVGMEKWHSTTPFVGREDERSMLQATFARAVKNRTIQLVTITGPR